MNEYEFDDHRPACAANCDEPLFLVASTGEYECDNGHTGHDCTCDEIAADDAEREAQAFLDDASQEFMGDHGPRWHS
jgi:hypothetical protein